MSSVINIPFVYYKHQHKWLCGRPCTQAHRILVCSTAYARLTETFLETNKLLMKLQFSILPTKPQLHFSFHCELGEEPSGLCAQHLPSGTVKYTSITQEKPRKITIQVINKKRILYIFFFQYVNLLLQKLLGSETLENQI